MKEIHTRFIIFALIFTNFYQLIFLNQTCQLSQIDSEPISPDVEPYLDLAYQENHTSSSLDVFKESIDLFKRICLKYGTDKVTTHHYEHLYGTVLGLMPDKELNVLEIGLGCDMPYGPGKSLKVWNEFLPKANISVLEYNEPCALAFRNRVKHMFVGDQSDLKLLNAIGRQGGPYDVIIDDGGHTRKQQVNSLIGLWPFVARKGFYVIEDFFTSFIKSYNDNVESSFDLVMQLLILLNNPSDVAYAPPHEFPNMKISASAKKISLNLLSINCYERACVLVKK